MKRLIKFYLMTFAGLIAMTSKAHANLLFETSSILSDSAYDIAVGGVKDAIEEEKDNAQWEAKSSVKGVVHDGVNEAKKSASEGRVKKNGRSLTK